MTQRTLLLIKPNAVADKNAGEIISMVEHHGFTIAAARVFTFDEALSRRFYHEHLDKEFYPRLQAFMCSGQSWALILERVQAVPELRQLLGDVDPAKRVPGSIRGRFGKGITDNAAHGSDSVHSAEREIAVIFT